MVDQTKIYRGVGTVGVGGEWTEPSIEDPGPCLMRSSGLRVACNRKL